MIEHDRFGASCSNRLRDKVRDKVRAELKLDLTALEYCRSCLGDLIVTVELKYLVALCDHVLHTSRH